MGASPGKTTHINYFLIDQKAYLVDLPGYGYAKVSRSEKERWARLMETYFQREADAITTGVLIVDIRHKPTANDLVMHDWFHSDPLFRGKGQRKGRIAPPAGRCLPRIKQKAWTGPIKGNRPCFFY